MGPGGNVGDLPFATYLLQRPLHFPLPLLSAIRKEVERGDDGHLVSIAGFRQIECPGDCLLVEVLGIERRCEINAGELVGVLPLRLVVQCEQLRHRLGEAASILRIGLDLDLRQVEELHRIGGRAGTGWTGDDEKGDEGEQPLQFFFLCFGPGAVAGAYPRYFAAIAVHRLHLTRESG